METIEIIYKGETYVSNYFSQGKTWFSKPCLEILKDNKVIYKNKSYNNFVLNSFFCEKGIISLIERKIDRNMFKVRERQIEQLLSDQYPDTESDGCVFCGKCGSMK